MNDLTLEELQTIITAIDGLVFSKFYADDTRAVYNKIKSMIDNYCRHTDSNISFNCEDCGLVL